MMGYKTAPWYYLFILVMASEAIFILPFVLPRVFRPTILTLFEVTNTELGLCFSVYGVVALFSYLFGGPIADTYAPRKLIAVALWLTALGGVLFAWIPGFKTLLFLYGYWGFTTIFLFWAPMVKATRVWGGAQSQGKAFGFLDGGRGLTAAFFGLLGVVIFSVVMGGPGETTALWDQRRGFSSVIYSSVGIMVFIGLLVWFFMKSETDGRSFRLDKISPSDISAVLKLPSVWMLMIIVLCAYTGYKITDIVAQYAQEVLFYDAVASAQIGTFFLFLRAFTAIAIGFFADKGKATVWLLIGFSILFFGAVLFATGITSAAWFIFILSSMVLALGVYGVRALYFAVMQEGRIPIKLTGTAVGIISVVGFAPDIFAGPGMGYLLDSNPGETGHTHVFWALAGFSVIGFFAALRYHRLFGRFSLDSNG